jgi:multidrug resistance efflux pump
MNRHLFTVVALGGLSPLGLALPPTLLAPVSQDPAAAPRVMTVKRAPFVVKLDVAGVFHERNPVVLRYRPKANLNRTEVIEAAAPGRVEKGQVLVRLRSPALDEKIRSTENDIAANRGRLQRLTEESRRAEIVRQLRLARSDLEVLDAQRALKVLVTINAPQRLRSSEERVRDWDVLQGEREESFQIRVRMYQADGVIETTERMDIESHQRRLVRSRLGRPRVVDRHKILKTITIPREVTDLELALRKAKHSRDLLQASSAQQVEQKRHQLVKHERDLRRQDQQLDKLKHDRKALTVRAPVDGYAIAGHYDGRWQALAETEHRLRPGARVAARDVLYTIVQSAPKLVRTAVPENMLFAVSEAQEATLIPTAVPSVKLPAVVTRVVGYSENGKFGVWLYARTRHERLFPGSTCRVKITLRDNPKALTVPTSAIHHDQGTTSILVTEDGVATRRLVEIGLSSDDRTEILTGVEVGEKVLVERGS